MLSKDHKSLGIKILFLTIYNHENVYCHIEQINDFAEKKKNNNNN
jgi:hypothetical protein